MKSKNKIATQNISFGHKNLNVGFELECFYDDNKMDFPEVLKSLEKIHPNIIVGGDGSLRHNNPNFCAIEIKTPILRADKGMALLNELFNWIKKYGCTNQTCGFHTNFSPIKDKQYTRFNPVLFTNHPIWGTIGRYFGRNRNRYCYNAFSNLKKIRSISENIQLVQGIYDKYTAVSLRNWPVIRRPDSRIEIRIFGGKDYEKKFQRISYYTDKVFTLFSKVSARELPVYKL